MTYENEQSLKLKFHFFWVDEDEQLHKIPQARYQRVFNREEAITLFAGKTIRFIQAHSQSDEQGQNHLFNAIFPHYHFDGAGLWREDQKTSEFQGAARMLSVFGQKEWEELYKYEYQEPNRWKPTASIIEDLRQALLIKKKRM